MGTHYFVEGIKPPDDDWKRMKAIWDACEEADVDPPDEVERFFDGEKPDPKGVTMRLGDTWEDRTHHECFEYGSEDSRAWFDVEIDKLPKDVKIIRFEMGW